MNRKFSKYDKSEYTPMKVIILCVVSVYTLFFITYKWIN